MYAEGEVALNEASEVYWDIKGVEFVEKAGVPYGVEGSFDVKEDCRRAASGVESVRGVGQKIEYGVGGGALVAKTELGVGDELVIRGEDAQAVREDSLEGLTKNCQEGDGPVRFWVSWGLVRFGDHDDSRCFPSRREIAYSKTGVEDVG